jgi:uncharacterized membrane protein
MRRAQMATILAATLAIGAGSRALGSADHHADSRRPHGCTNETLKGMYGIQIQGTRPSAPGGPVETVIGMVTRDYDGLGQFTQVDNVKGSISGWVPDRVGGGTYDVSADCTAIVHAQPAPNILLEERLVIVGDGREVLSATMMPPPVMVTAIGRRRHNE